MIILDVDDTGLIKVIDDNAVIKYQFSFDIEKLTIGMMRTLEINLVDGVYKILTAMLVDPDDGSRIDLEMSGKVISLLSIEQFATIVKNVENFGHSDS